MRTNRIACALAASAALLALAGDGHARRRRAPAPPSGRAAPAPDAAAAHDADAPAAGPPPGAALPQACDMQPFGADYGGLREGSRVRLARHRPVDGDRFWATAMDPFVGRITTVLGPRGVDTKGCPLVAVAADDGEFDWRVRDLEVVGGDAVDAHHTVTLRAGFAGDPRVFEGTVSTESPLSTLRDGCAGKASRGASLRIVLEDDLETVVFLAHADVDLVLAVRAPDGTVTCADDVDARDPVISGTAARGAYEVWVGGYDDDTDGARFLLGISEKLTVVAGDLEGQPAVELGDTRARPVARPRDDDDARGAE